MAKKNKDKPLVSVELDVVEILGKKFNEGFKYLDKYTDIHASDPNYIPEYLQPFINDFVRKARKDFDIVTEEMESYDKASDKHIAASKKREDIARKLITLKEQLGIHKTGISAFKQALGNMNEGTKEIDVITNMLAFTDQADIVKIDDLGRLHFGGRFGKATGGPRKKRAEKENEHVFKLDDMADPTSGESPIIQEPFETKMFVWNLAEKINQDRVNKVPFNYDWVYTRVFDELSSKGTQNTIGMAFTDIAADQESGSFAKMWGDGLADPVYYIDPRTGKPILGDNEWMKNFENSDVLTKFLGKYITDIMRDIYGSIDETTGQLEKTKSELAQELIKKYRK